MKKDFSNTVKKLKNVQMNHVDNTFLFESYLKTKNFNKLYDKMLWGEGPTWWKEKNCLIWSDVPNNRQLILQDGNIKEFLNPSNFVNGNTIDNNGNLLSCSHGGRCIYKFDQNLNKSIILDNYEGKKLNSPNDICVKSNDDIYFTDPDYGIRPNGYEGFPGKKEYGNGSCWAFKFNHSKNKLVPIIKDLNRPNGISFNSDESKLYVADTGEGIKHLYSYDLDEFNELKNKKLIYDFKPFFSDGFRSDKDNNIWTSAGKGIKCFNDKGELIGQLILPELVSNLEFGGSEGNILYVTATTSLYMMELNQIGSKYQK